MGFNWDKFQGGGGAFVTAAEKLAIANAGIPFLLTSIRVDKDRFEKPQYVLSVLLPNPETGEDEERAMGFSIGSNVGSRDKTLRALKEGDGEDYPGLDNGGEPISIKLEKAGNAWIILPAAA